MGENVLNGQIGIGLELLGPVVGLSFFLSGRYIKKIFGISRFIDGHLPGGAEDGQNTGPHLTSAAAFVEGGIQDAYEDACSICLEVFCDSDPSTVTSCKHEFHLQCVLEWYSQILKTLFNVLKLSVNIFHVSLKVPKKFSVPYVLAANQSEGSNQELLEGVERERNLRLNPPRSSAIFHHPTLGDFELQHLPVGINDAELEERIIQHLAAAAAMGRARHNARREGQRNRSSAQGRQQQFLVFSTNSNASPSGPASSPTRREDEQSPTSTLYTPSSYSPIGNGEESSQPATPSPLVLSEQAPATASGSAVLTASQQGSPLTNRRSPNQSSPSSQERAGPSELQSFSESLKSRLNAVSTRHDLFANLSYLCYRLYPCKCNPYSLLFICRYKESISKSTRGWKERLFSRNSPMADLGSEVRREVNAGIATVSRMMERLETRDNNTSSVSNSPETSSVTESSDHQRLSESVGQSTPNNNTNMQAPRATSSGSN
ncbi:hypothetical protein ACFE04_019278 [Oxalis oulophora]